MNQICSYELCTGCQACKEACPVQAIHMEENSRGFVYPQIDQSICVNCKKCTKICPAINPQKKNPAQETVYAAWTKDSSNRWFSTSGGISYELSKWIVENGGVFCGCRWNIDHAEHICCDRIEDLHQFQGSKYTYSNINGVYTQIRTYLKSGRKVLFVGTACQVAGLKSFLVKEYDNLYTVEILCHGIPSLSMLRERISQVEKENNKKVIDIRFRNKVTSQHNTCMKYTYEDGTTFSCSEFSDFFSRGFESNYFLRENCFQCQYATPKRVADLTIADFWGYRLKQLRYKSHRKGTSLVLVNTAKGSDLFKILSSKLIIDKRSFEEAAKCNPNLYKPQTKPITYDVFWERLQKGENILQLHQEYFPPIEHHEMTKLESFKRDIKVLLHELHYIYYMKNSSLPYRVVKKIIRYCLRTKTALSKGKELNVDNIALNKINTGYGDWFVHPCVRYIEEGFAGHKWWMVVTPYPYGNSKYENPVLYYGNGNSSDVPDNWTMVGIVQDTHPEGGYNADGNLYFDGERLWIIWKENDTNNTCLESGNRTIMGCYYDGKSFSKPQVFVHNPNDKSMYIAAPVLCKIDGELKMLGVYSPVIGDNCKGALKKPREIAVFRLDENNFNNLPLKFEKIAKQEYRAGFDFWHIDCFEAQNKHYCLVTPERGQEILMGESVDGLSYKFFDIPLLHENGRQRIPYMYKPSGVVIGDKFHLFYPSRINKDQVHIFCTSTSFNKLLNKLK